MYIHVYSYLLASRSVNRTAKVEEEEEGEEGERKNTN